MVADREAKKPDAVAICAALQKHGLKLGMANGRGYVRCPEVLEKAHAKNKLDTLLDVASAWRDSTSNEHALVSKSLRALLELLLAMPDIDVAELQRKLSRHDPEKMLVQTTAQAKAAGEKFEIMAVARFRKIYSSKLKSA
jgi:hypothetical protein